VDLLSPVRVQQALAVERNHLLDQRQIGGIRPGCDRGDHRAEIVRQGMGTQRQPGGDAEGPASAALEGPEQVRVLDRVGDAHGPVRGDDLRLEQVRRRGAETLREAAETTALHQAADTDGRAPPALHIAAADGGDSSVGIHPDRAGAHAHGGLGLDLACGALGHETVVELDVPHVGPGPYQQRIRRVRAAEIAVTASFHGEADTMLASELHRRRDIGAASGQDRICAGLRGPRIGPAEGLGQGDAAIDVVGILQVLEQVGARRAAGVGRAHGEGRVHLHQTPADALTELRPLRWVGPARLAGPDMSDRLHSDATRGGGGTGKQRQHGRGLQ
jgi:hypothetical protein